MPTNRIKQIVYSHTVGITLALLVPTGSHAQSVPVTLGDAASFGVLAGTAVTNTGPTVVYGDVGVSGGSAVTGFPPGTVVPDGTSHFHSNDALAIQAQKDLIAAYDVIAGETPTSSQSVLTLGSQTLMPGVYHFSSATQLTGTLTLDAGNNPNARFDFQIDGDLTTDSFSSVLITNGGNADDVFWQVNGSATLGASTAFQGNLLALKSITMVTGATNSGGRALAHNGAVTLDSNTVGFNGMTTTNADASAPEPSAVAYLVLLGLPSVIGLVRHRRGK